MRLEEYSFSVNPKCRTLRKRMVSQQGLLKIVYFMYTLVEYSQLQNKTYMVTDFFYKNTSLQIPGIYHIVSKQSSYS